MLLMNPITTFVSLLSSDARHLLAEIILTSAVFPPALAGPMIFLCMTSVEGPSLLSASVEDSFDLEVETIARTVDAWFAEQGRSLPALYHLFLVDSEVLDALRELLSAVNGILDA